MSGRLRICLNPRNRCPYSKLENDGPQGPMTLRAIPYLACNLNCSFDTPPSCRPPVHELSEERLLEIVDEAALMGVAWLFLLGGGEPLLRKNCYARQSWSAQKNTAWRASSPPMEPYSTNNSLRRFWISRMKFTLSTDPDRKFTTSFGQSGVQKTIQNAWCLAARRKRGIINPRIALHFITDQ